MNKSILVLLLAGLFIFSCSQNTTEEKDTKEDKKSDQKEKTEKGPRKLEMVKTSELATLMRLMETEMKSAKTSIEGGYPFHDSLTFAYGNIHSAIPTEANMKKTGFDDFANAYLTQLEIFKTSKGDNRKENYNLLVNSCLNCHSVHCPGPVNKIKDLRIGKE